MLCRTSSQADHSAQSAAGHHYPLSPIRQSLAHGSLCLVAAAAVALVGCADLRWHKDGADPAALAHDLAGCRQFAFLQARRLAWPFGFSTALSPLGVDRLGRFVAPYPSRFETDRFLLEHEFARSCMRGRGYELAPVEKH